MCHQDNGFTRNGIGPSNCLGDNMNVYRHQVDQRRSTPALCPLSRESHMMRNRKGFTLIELLIVVVIIGILAAIAIPKFANTKEKAYYTAMKSDLRNLMTAEEAYFADSSKYSANPVDLNNF